jgi:competence protein ComEC
MPHSPAWPVWKEAPFVRLIVPFITGIICEWYWPLPVLWAWSLLAISCLALWLFSFIPLAYQYHIQWWNGIWLHSILFITGFLLIHYKDIRHDNNCITRQYIAGKALLATIEEPLSEKNQSYKTVASVQAVFSGDSVHSACGNVLLYFHKDSTIQHLHYGTQLILYKTLLPVKNTGNPGSFDYQRYCIFQGILYQAYLKQGEYVALKIKNENLIRKHLLSTEEKIVSIFKKFIPRKKEAGLAEAMLIGYKEDLDKSLVQSYSNTGVVHIIAISGLHLALIYWLLALICKPFGHRTFTKYGRPIVIIAGLWLFSMLTGGSPSVMRSAVMFTCVVMGSSLNRKASLYNSLAASAFLLLCYNPFWLWDAGFQLSYAAVLSLGIFFKPIYSLLFFQNKILDFIWKPTAVTLAAQILTAPVSIYLFHQFPNFFLLANLPAVPLSSLIIIVEIALCIVSAIPVIATGTGYLLQQLIYWLNTYIEQIGKLPFAISNNLQIDLLQLVCLYICLCAMAWWLMNKKKAGAYITLTAFLLFSVLRAVAMYEVTHQRKIVIYNIPQHSAIDVIIGRHYLFKGDSSLLQNEAIHKFYLQPCRLLHRVINRYYTGDLLVWKNFFRYGHTSFFVLDQSLEVIQPAQKIVVDMLILSKNAPVHISEITGVFTCRTIIFDSSNSLWKVNKWKQECTQLGIPCYSVAEQGAFVLNLY